LLGNQKGRLGLSSSVSEQVMESIKPNLNLTDLNSEELIKTGSASDPAGKASVKPTKGRMIFDQPADNISGAENRPSIFNLNKDMRNLRLLKSPI
jgi:hypothetical protein